MSDWYIKTANGKHGPVDVSKLKKLAAAGKLKQSTKIASLSKTDGKWVQVSSVPVLSKLIGPANELLPASDFEHPVQQVVPPMTQQPQPIQAVQIQPSVQQVVVNQKESNVIGTAGFVLSILSLITCGLLSPLAALTSFIGLFFKPNKHAIAGLIISLGSLALLAICWVLFLGAMITGGSYVVAQANVLRENAEASVGVREFFRENERLPSETEFDEIIGEAAERVSIQPIDDSKAKLIHVGIDGKPGTPDDHEFEFDAAESTPPLEAIPE